MNAFKKQSQFIISVAVVVLTISFSSVHAQENQVELAFRKFFDIDTLQISTPTVVQVELSPALVERNDYAIQDIERSSFEPYYLKQNTIAVPVVASADGIGDAHFVTDGKIETFTEFPVSLDEPSTVEILFTASKPITASSLTILLDNNVALPNYIALEATTGRSSKVVIAEKQLTSTSVVFPKTTATTWKLRLKHIQPLRISEISFLQENQVPVERTLRFLAQPQTSYRVYFDPDRSISVPVGESGNLAGAENILSIPQPAPQINIRFKKSDSDGDTIPDILDNCISVKNKDQADTNDNKRGDACDDFDFDGLKNIDDNCPGNPNLDQRDSDSDSVGDACDDDESRITERLTWLPWLGIGIASLVVIGLFAMLARKKKDPPSTKLWNEPVGKTGNTPPPEQS